MVPAASRSAKVVNLVEKTKMFLNIKRFARTTSLKGVPRIINNEIICLKVVWLCSVLVFFGLGIWQVMLIHVFEKQNAFVFFRNYTKLADLAYLSLNLSFIILYLSSHVISF